LVSFFPGGPWGLAGDVNPHLGAGVQDSATGLDTPLVVGLHNHAFDHNVDSPSLGVGLLDHAFEHGDDPQGGLVWSDRALGADGIPPLGTGLRDRASKLGKGPSQRKRRRFQMKGCGRFKTFDGMEESLGRTECAPWTSG
jgi:hypothetical protein